MPDDLNKKRPQDATKVNINEPWEVKYWTDKLNCTKKELENAVKAVGVNVVDVKKKLK